MRAASIDSATPPEARGKIGQAALIYGVGSKSDENIEGSRAHWEACPSDRLLPMPTSGEIDVSWSAAEVEQRVTLSEKIAAVGDFSLANLWRNNLRKPRSRYVDNEGLERLAARIVEAAAARRGERAPTVPERLLASFSEVALAGAGHDRDFVPIAIRQAVVDELNRLLWDMARAGFGRREEIRNGGAPHEVVELNIRFSCIQGATSRVVNQIGLLLKASRAGQTLHSPMTLGRRRMLVNAALQQLADELEAPAWTVDSLGLVTDELRQAWADRAQREPLPVPYFRNLFAWADRDRPPPAELDDPDLDRLIQQHRDMDYVETLRAEKRTRLSSPLAEPCDR